MSSFTARAPYTDAQRREAADWFVTIHAHEEPSSESIHAWLQWLDQDQGNRDAFEAVMAAWHATPSAAAQMMASAEELRQDGYEGDQSVAEWLARKSAADAPPQAPHEGRRSLRYPRLLRRTLLAAASVVTIALGLHAMSHYQTLHGLQSGDFRTRAGEQIELTLADGSHVWLGPKSRLLVAFSRDRRGIRLAAGEAYFSVRKDRSRPFSVSLDSGDITAVGTAFNVRAVNDRVTVAVSEGVVTVAPTSQLAMSEPAAVRVASGQQLTFSAQEPLRALTVIQSRTPGERASWRTGVLVYRDEPLRDVVADIARYTDKPIEITDAGIGTMRYSGVVYEAAIDEWAAALSESFPVKVVVEGNSRIIRPR